jgi:hypothetical protein
MLTLPRFPRDFILRKICLLVMGGLLAGFAKGDAVQSQPNTTVTSADKNNISDAIEKARQDNPESIYYVEQIAHARAVQAVPMLEEKFVRTKDPLDKAKVAQVLIKLGDKNDIYWNFLVELATPALESDAPDFMSFDAQGKSSPGPSPAFIAWAKAHNVPPNGPEGTAAEDAMYWLPGRVALLGSTGDPRAVPLLRRALLSPNHMIEVVAAEGLAELQDRESIPLIIGACQRAPAEMASVIAESLVYFDSPEAQRAVDTYVPKETAMALRQSTAQGKKTPWSY